MIVRALKRCDICGDVLAEKRLLWHTTQWYITLRIDDKPLFDEYNTEEGEYHLCFKCWLGVKNSATRELKK